MLAGTVAPCDGAFTSARDRPNAPVTCRPHPSTSRSCVTGVPSCRGPPRHADTAYVTAPGRRHRNCRPSQRWCRAPQGRARHHILLRDVRAHAIRPRPRGDAPQPLLRGPSEPGHPGTLVRKGREKREPSSQELGGGRVGLYAGDNWRFCHRAFDLCGYGPWTSAVHIRCSACVTERRNFTWADTGAEPTALRRLPRLRRPGRLKRDTAWTSRATMSWAMQMTAK